MVTSGGRVLIGPRLPGEFAEVMDLATSQHR